ncbi:MAG: heparinase II/III-family protein, partial [Nitrospira sp.]
FSQEDGSRTSCYQLFENTGYSAVRDHSNDMQMIFDHGSLGMGPCYAHGHADALAVVLSRGHEDILIDPGTYTYTGDQNWRTYFRSTRAHNTVLVDDLDQAVQETAFMWSHPYRAELVHKEKTPEGKVILLARHDGYKKRVGVTHWRAVIFEPPGCWLIWDRLVGSGDHRLELNWHLGVEPRLESDRYLLQIDECRLALVVEGMGPPYPAATIRNGWRSRHYGIKEPISTLQTHYTGMLPYEFSTRLWVNVVARRDESAFQSLALLRSLTGDIDPS